jgi:hypothetical protein
MLAICKYPRVLRPLIVVYRVLCVYYFDLGTLMRCCLLLRSKSRRDIISGWVQLPIQNLLVCAISPLHSSSGQMLCPQTSHGISITVRSFWSSSPNTHPDLVIMCQAAAWFCQYFASVKGYIAIQQWFVIRQSPLRWRLQKTSDVMLDWSLVFIARWCEGHRTWFRWCVGGGSHLVFLREVSLKILAIRPHIQWVVQYILKYIRPC